MARRKDQTGQLNRRDYSIESVFVPDEMTFPLMDLMLGNAVTGGAALRLGAPALVTPFHIGIALGIARRALDEITEQAVEKGRGLPPSPLKEVGEILHVHPSTIYKLTKQGRIQNWQRLAIPKRPD
jgi:hypothetical protein